MAWVSKMRRSEIVFAFICLFLLLLLLLFFFFETLRSNRQNSFRIGKTHEELARLASNWQDSFLIRKILYGPHRGNWQLLRHLLTWSQNRTSLVRYLGQLFPHVCPQTRDAMSHFCYPRTAMDSTKIMETNSFSGRRHTVREKICIWKDFALSALISCSF